MVLYARCGGRLVEGRNQRWWREILGPPAACRKIFGSADKLLTRCHLQCSLAPLVQIGAQSDKSEPWTS